MKNVVEVPFLIIGGGIGGLSAALGVAETGRIVTVIERAPEFGEVGAGIQLSPNATAVLDRLGVMEAIKKVAVFPKRLVLKDAMTGKELSALDLGEAFLKRYGHPYIVLHRADLLNALLEKCRKNERITLLNNQNVESVEDCGDHIKVHCENGTTYVAGAVIGADGLRSKTRKLFIDDEPVCSQYVAYRGTLPLSEVSSSYTDTDDVIMWIGPNLHLVQYPVRRKELYNQVVVFKSYCYKEGSDDWGTPEEMEERFKGACDTVQRALGFISRQRRWPMYDRNPMYTWAKGKVALLGDAAHPMLQYLAQGGVQALEDVASLTNHLKTNADDIERAFQQYQEERVERGTSVQKRARLWGEIIHADNPVTILLRNTIMQQRDSMDFSYVDWFYSKRY